MLTVFIVEDEFHAREKLKLQLSQLPNINVVGEAENLTDAIVRIIGENWHKFKDDERINNGLLHQIEQLKSQINNLQEQLNSVQNVAFGAGLRLPIT